MVKICEVVDGCEDCPKYGDDCDGNKMTQHTDIISRADAIDAFENKISIEGEANAYKFGLYVQGVIDKIKSLPSAEAVPWSVADKIGEDRERLEERVSELEERLEWIPVSERLPNESGDYLCTIPLDACETYTEVLTFHKGRFYEDDDEWGATYHDDVLAWMPLPTPYKGGDDE